MNLPLKVKMKVILLTLLNIHLNNNIRSEPIQIFKQYCLKKQLNRIPQSVLLMAEEIATTSGEEHVALPPKVSKAKQIPQKGQKAEPKLVTRKGVIPQKAMASNTDMDVEDYYIVEDDNESASSKYVPCINYPNDKVYPEDEKNGGVRLDQDTGPPNIYRFEGSCQNYLNLNKYTPGAVFDEFFEDRMWTILSKNTNKYVHTKLREAKDKGDKDPIELLSEGVDQNPCA